MKMFHSLLRATHTCICDVFARKKVYVCQKKNCPNFATCIHLCRKFEVDCLVEIIIIILFCADCLKSV